ncbi:MAG: TonB-dependent receptor [Acidobacteriia bacterium]|nr:TonB-dependent receptor [Terriglobia bacterium]
MRIGWSLRVIGFLAIAAPLAFGQGSTATVTGAITDPSGLAIAGATVQVKSVDTGALYQGASTSTGNYAVPNLPVGNYTLTATAPGFKTYTHTNFALVATQVLREDIPLQVGTATETVTVEAQATLLKTETGENSTNVTLEQMQDLPLLGIGTTNSGTTGVRNPYNVLLTLPGVSGYVSGTAPFVLNGLGGGFVLSETMRIEGQDATSRMFNAYTYLQMAQPNADAIQEVAYQTSNYAPEFGQAGSVVINMTMKSGTNQYHGSAFEYFVNEDLNSGQPFSISGGAGGGDGSKFRPRNRRNDFGGTMGGPISIPKIYNGKDRTFFFFAYEEYLETNLYSFTDTVPTADYLGGNFSHISPNGDCSFCAAQGITQGPLGGVIPQGQPNAGQPNYTDALGRPVYANEIYDPTSRAVNPANGRAYANPFSNNVVPASMFNSTSLAIQKLFPSAQNANLIGNYLGTVPGNRYSAIPSLKIDQIISPKDKLSFYWSRINTESQVSVPLGAADGLPLAIGQYRGTFIPSTTVRVNYDRTLTPTLLFHAGAGYYYTSFSDRAPNLTFDPTSIGLNGFLIHRNFPVITGMCTAPALFGASTGCGGYGGMQQLGPGAGQSQNYEEKPSFNATATWVKGNHTFKTGAELYLEQNYTGNISLVTLATGTGPTSLPENPTVGFGGFSQGFGYASFLLGDYNGTTQGPNRNYRVGNQTWGLFLQDSWKVTRKLTLDYGLRWDYNTPYHEQYGRFGQLDPTAANPNAGGRLGATRFASTCNCDFYQAAYPYAIGPRLGAAYQITPKTVFRGGFGVNYQYIGANAGGVVGTNGIYPLAGVNPFVNISTPGAIVQPSWLPAGGDPKSLRRGYLCGEPLCLVGTREPGYVEPDLPRGLRAIRLVSLSRVRSRGLQLFVRCAGFLLAGK